jgi:hypothetical protein
MYDDYDLDYTYTNDYADLDEYYAQDIELDEDYARDSHDLEALAYRHYAWYTRHTTHIETIMIAQKRLVRVTLDIMCYDDLDVENMNWKELLELEGDEDVYATTKEFEPLM